MEKIAEIIRLHFKLDLSVRQTSSALNVSRSSVGDYCQKFKYLNLRATCKFNQAAKPISSKLNFLTF